MKKYTEQYNTQFEEVMKYQKKYEEMWKSYEESKDDPEVRKLAWENMARRNELSRIRKLKEKEELTIKKYKDKINKIENSENNFKNTGVAKVVNFGKMPLEQAKEAVANLKTLQDKYPFMKGKLEYVGSQDTQEFKEWYKDLVIETQFLNNYANIIRNIENAENTVRNYEEKLSDDLKKDVYEELRYKNAKSMLEEVKKYGEDEFVRRYIATHYRTTKRFVNRIWAYFICGVNKEETGSIIFNSNNYDTHGRPSGDFHPVGCNTQKSVLDHEFGHSIYYALRLDKVFGNAENSPLGKLHNFIVEEYRKKKDYIRQNLSLYAATNLSEFFAEAFAEYQNNPKPRHIAKTVGEYLEQYKKELEDGTDERRFQERLKEI